MVQMTGMSHVKDKPIESDTCIVLLDPTPGIYLEDPISVLDYSSLYPILLLKRSFENSYWRRWITKENYILNIIIVLNMTP